MNKYLDNKQLVMRVGDVQNEIFLNMTKDELTITFNDQELTLSRDYYLILGAFISKFNEKDFPEIKYVEENIN